MKNYKKLDQQRKTIYISGVSENAYWQQFQYRK